MRFPEILKLIKIIRNIDHLGQIKLILTVIEIIRKQRPIFFSISRPKQFISEFLSISYKALVNKTFSRGACMLKAKVCV